MFIIVEVDTVQVVQHFVTIYSVRIIDKLSLNSESSEDYSNKKKAKVERY
jgi:hypothetical protein